MTDRKLSDDDIQAIVDELETRLEKRFYQNLGRGLWAAVKRALIVVLIALVMLGIASKDGWPWT